MLESDPEDMEDKDFCFVSYGIEIGPVHVILFLETLETFSPHEHVHCSKLLFEAVKFRDTEPIAKIKLAIVSDWSGCAITLLIFKTDNSN